jgi:ATP-dependent Clp protease protease subunit
MNMQEINMTDMLTFELPKSPSRIWDLDVPIVVNERHKIVTAYITGKIEEPNIYNELCYMLTTASEDSTIHLHINTPGGIIDSAFMIVQAIKESKGHVIGKLSGTVASAGTLIAMACDEIEAASHLSFMIHNYSGGMSGKGHEMKARQKFTDEHLNDAFKRFYNGFLSKDEMNSVIEGTDLWMNTEEVTHRWQHRIDYLCSESNAN